MVVLVLLGGEQMLVAHLALPEIPVEIAFVPRGGFGIHFDDYVGERPQQIAVVRDQHQRTPVLLEVALQPVHRRKVQIVGRLVEKQKVWFGSEDAAQFRAHPPTARERRERFRELVGGEAKSAERDLDARLQVVAAEVLEFRLHLAVFLEQLFLAEPVRSIDALIGLKAVERIERRLKLVHARLEFMESGHAAHRIFEQGLFRGVWFRMLARRSDARLFFDYEFALVGGKLTQYYLEERGLPGAVRPHYADAFVLVDAEGYIRKDILEAIADGYVLEI